MEILHFLNRMGGQAANVLEAEKSFARAFKLLTADFDNAPQLYQMYAYMKQVCPFAKPYFMCL